MKIAMTGNVFPFGKGIAYGGERIIGYLSDALAKRGHDIYLFSPKGTVPTDNMKDYTPVDIDYTTNTDDYAETVYNYEKKNKIKFDVYQCNYFGEKWDKTLKDKFKVYAELTWNRWCHCKVWNKNWGEAENIISYSSLLQEDFDNAGVSTTMIHYGIPKDLYQFSPESDDYCVWIAKIEGGKRPDLAIKLAKAAGIKIVLLGPPYNTGCFWNQVAPYIDNENVFWVRGVDDEQKQRIMSRAKFFISSNGNDWREHCGITNFESLAMGVPIIAFNKIKQECAIWTDRFIKEGKHGFFLNYNDADDIDEIMTKGLPLIHQIGIINREECRIQFERNFTSDIMAQKYEVFYNFISEHGNVHSLTIEEV